MKRDLILQLVPIMELRPTQITVGMQEVKQKRAHWEGLSDKRKRKVLGDHLIPVVKRADKSYYIVDHHHLARALHAEEVEEVQISVIADLSMVHPKSFWVVMDDRHWVHPYDENGERRRFSDIPETIIELRDDPYRSIAGQLRRDGGFAKDTTPFSEFLWADYLRWQIPKRLIKDDFKRASRNALKLAARPEARYLPGWCGKTED